MSEVTFKKHRVFRETQSVIFYDISVEASDLYHILAHEKPVIHTLGEM